MGAWAGNLSLWGTERKAQSALAFQWAVPDSVQINVIYGTEYVTDLNGLGGGVILSEHCTAWWSDNREVTEASNKSVVCFIVTKLLDSRVKIRSSFCHFPDFARLVGALTSWEKIKETNSCSKSSAFVSPDPTWMLKSPVITTSPKAWLRASSRPVNLERKTENCGVFDEVGGR
jgi:hypothetical protein